MPALLGAAMRISEDGGSDEDLRLLLAPGSSLGGARPKASVIDKDGSLPIAKFPQHDDTTRVSLWEAVALKLAAQAGIPVPLTMSPTATWRSLTRSASTGRKPTRIAPNSGAESCSAF